VTKKSHFLYVEREGSKMPDTLFTKRYTKNIMRKITSDIEKTKTEKINE